MLKLGLFTHFPEPMPMLLHFSLYVKNFCKDTKEKAERSHIRQLSNEETALQNNNGPETKNQMKNTM